MSRTLRIQLLLLAACALSACGDDDDNGVDLGKTDAGMMHDAATDAALDAEVTPPPPPDMHDAGHDAGMKDAGPAPVDVEDDAGAPKCNERLCKAMSDECHVAHCDDTSGECKLSARPNGTACGNSTLDNCSLPDTCQAGACKPNDSAEGTACGDQGVDCHKNDACDGHGKCVDKGLKAKGSACGDRSTENDCDALDTCDSKGVCQLNYAAVDAPCGDQNQLCRNDDKCDGIGHCIDGGAWAAGQCPMGETGGACLCQPNGTTTTCHPNADVCADITCVLGNALDGISCGDVAASDPECDAPDSCKSGVCSQNNVAPSVACGDHGSHGACDLPDRCDGAGSCSPNYASSSTTCGDAPSECDQEPLCDGSGSCQSALPAPVGTACGSSSDSDCNHADTCDGSGDCGENLAANDSPCGDHSTTECTAPDTCNAAGICQPHNAAQGTNCGDQGQLCKLDDHCDANGSCADAGETATCGISGTITANQAAVAGVTVELLGADATSTVTDVDGHYQLTVPLGHSVTLRVHDVAGNWGVIEPRRFSAEDATQDADYSLPADAYFAELATNVSGLSVNTAKGLVVAQFNGDDLSGHERVTSSASSSTPVVLDEDGDFVSSTTIMNTQFGLMYFYNMQVGSTTLTPSTGCAFAPTFTQPIPVVAHHIISVNLVCN